MIAFLYKWRVKWEMEDHFIDNWSIVTEHYREKCGSLGSRLHRGSDGFFYSYAQWPSKEIRQKAFQDEVATAAYSRMQEAVEESFPDVPLEIVADFIIPSA